MDDLKKELVRLSEMLTGNYDEEVLAYRVGICLLNIANELKEEE